VCRLRCKTWALSGVHPLIRDRSLASEPNQLLDAFDAHLRAAHVLDLADDLAVGEGLRYQPQDEGDEHVVIVSGGRPTSVQPLPLDSCAEPFDSF
jgi:hypothetical protein